MIHGDFCSECAISWNWNVDQVSGEVSTLG